MLVYAARGFLGLVYPIAVVLRVFLPQITEWSKFPPQAQAWLDIMKATGYLQILLYTTEFVAGIAILLGLFLPLAQIILASVSFNIALFHFFLDPKPLRILLVLLIIGAHLILAYRYRSAYQPLFRSIKTTWSGLVLERISIRMAIQVIISLIFIVAGAAKLLVPEQLNLGNLLVDGMKATGYLYTLLGITEVTAGLALLSNRFVPLTLIVMTPIVVNIFAYHLFLAYEGLPIAILLVAGHTALVTAYVPAYRALLIPLSKYLGT
ncbi:hypothetical protein Riv7116_4685 [Rivularia sp. PCC 7116]|uniref:hypothetical protein n=1 Tax=Rivularia sp. PCC 7116 TaxID=373994 RepID=UPI00029F2C92|nr:hypothetical protein [Rivularia sp. PCC 7116]AFY57102.1 hypothetical protein Riv7116_4685 [Rivularia sp. PCC 7116]